ncbi:MAG TPA: outer membrane lipoprotein chaperone LolA [Acidobacteriaceae bacterium]|nr:outer membrane lipoprotein chaperone LolA [Acidobacteriaceae bacterium]
MKLFHTLALIFTLTLTLTLPALTLTLTLPALAQPTGTAQPPADLLRRVDDHYNHLRTLRARYTEHYTGMGLDRTESGTLELQKPGLMRWSYDAPTGKVFILDGKFAWFYTPGDAQITRAPAKQLDDLRTPLRLLLGHTQLAKELDHPTITPAPNGTFTITGTPKAMADRVRAITLSVTTTGAIQTMKIEETTGAVTAFTFSSQQENAPIPRSAFVFTPPAGVPIVNAPPPI